MLTLGEELTTLGQRESTQYHLQQEREFRENTRLAGEIAKRMITDLPEFLRDIPSRGYRSAYLVGLDTYPPQQWEWPNKNFPEHSKLGCRCQCYRALFGVPLYLALWALREKLTVTINYGTALPDACVFENDKWHPFYKCAKGLIVSW